MKPDHLLECSWQWLGSPGTCMGHQMKQGDRDEILSSGTFPTQG